MLIGISGKMQVGKDTVAKIIQWTMLNKEKNINIPFESIDSYLPAFTYKNIKFADKLKDCVCLIIGCTREQLEDPIFKETPLGPEWDKYLIQYINHKSNKVYDVHVAEDELFSTLTDLSSKDYITIVSKELIKMTPRLILQLLGTECGRRIIHPNAWINATMADYKPQHFRNVKIDGVFSHQETIFPNWIVSDVRFPNEAKAIKDRGGILIKVVRDTGIESSHESETALDNYNDWDYIIVNNGTIKELISSVNNILIEEGI